MNVTTNSVFFSGETEARAVLAAANHFGVSPDQVVFDRVEKRHGFVKRRRVVIRVDPEQVGSGSEQPVETETEGLSPSASDDAASSAPEETPVESSVESSVEMPVESSATQEEAEPPVEDSEEILEIAQGAFRQLLELADLEVSADMVLADGRLEVEIEGVDQELLVEDEGQVLLALQHLLPRVMYGELGRIVPCRLDSGGYQRRKEERLRGLARRVADEVVSRGGIRTLRPMNPADRRIVHITLADDPDVETESHGNGYFKRVNIRSV
jgi:spoIIIJ-associated protein